MTTTHHESALLVAHIEERWGLPTPPNSSDSEVSGPYHLNGMGPVYLQFDRGCQEWKAVPAKVTTRMNYLQPGRWPKRDREAVNEALQELRHMAPPCVCDDRSVITFMGYRFLWEFHAEARNWTLTPIADR
ncbi:hypothetical protein [uncultured Sphingomonas sp.]|uniref:hypothetical protein n=1 Tax=uncultured Sphingomonas sp. TaxID=158754 RepID=UPI0025CC1B19|nr:hypothetical protein [uncultured Sphingomonas sp.]